MAEDRADTDLVAELVIAHGTMTTHRARCAGRCQDYRDALAAEDAILDEMAVRQGLVNWAPVEHPSLGPVTTDPATH
jgi:hypothetical protein